MLTLTRPETRSTHLGEVLRHEIDDVIDALLAPLAIDFSHLPWGSQRDETWM